ncbi:MAG: hypothetical protein H0Z28_13335 [Archaeoglobus sp.]|nr:hypothetical protein [Archaeoglobus sp.]
MRRGFLLCSLVVVFLISISVSSSEGMIIYVDDDADPSVGDGTMIHTYGDIETGVRAAAEGDTVMVLPGTYDITGVPASSPCQAVPMTKGVSPTAAIAELRCPEEKPTAKKQIRLASINPTVFFVRDKGELLQMVNVTIENNKGDIEAILEVIYDGERRLARLCKVKKGKSAFQAYVPDVNRPAEVQFILRTDGEVLDSRKMAWEVQRHWTVYIVPITHHDLGYTDPIEDVLAKYDGFYDNILRFCEQTDDWPEEAKYRYTVEGSWSIQHFIDNRPREVVGKLAKYLKQGRIEVSALFGNEISALCSHEGLVRLMYPSFRLKREYGAQIRSACIVDVPGLSWGLPTVLSGAGVKYFFAGLPTYFEWGRNDIHTFWDEAAILRHGRPDAFWWQGPDGQKVLVYYQGSYGFFKQVTGPHSYDEIMSNLPGMLKAMEKQGCPFDVVRYIHNGVDNCPPDVKISYIVSEWNQKWAYPRLVVSTNAMFFDALIKQCDDIRTFRGELPHTDYVVGAISAAKETSINRLTHDRLQVAEKVATIASLVCDYAYPAEEIRQAYDNMLLYDEHTFGMAYPAGRMQEWNWTDKSRYAYKAAGLTEAILQASLQKIANQVECKEQGQHIIVFNLLSFERTDVVRVPRFAEKGPFELIDTDTGEKLAYQIVELDDPLLPRPYAAHRYARGQFERHELNELVFVARDVPAMGYKSYRIVPSEKGQELPSNIVISQNVLENRFFKVTLDTRSGAIESIYDKELSRELVDTGAAHKFNQLVVRWVQTGKLECAEPVKIEKGQTGPVCSSVVIYGRAAGCPQIVQEISLYNDIKRIDFANRVLKDSRPLLEIYFAFPFKVDKPEFRFEGSNSVIKPLRDQFPGSNSNYYAVQHWADVSDGQMGVTLSCVESGLLEFGGLWPCYVSQAHHGVTPPEFGREFVKPEQMSKGHIYAFVIDNNFRTNFQPVQQGDMLFRYSVTTHTGDWRNGRPRDFGWAIANPLIAVLVGGGRDGNLAKSDSFCQINKQNVLITTLKRAEDGDGLIVRLVETEGEDTTAMLSFPHLSIKRAYLTNLVEENKGELACTQHSIMAPIRAFGITTIRLKVSK